MSLTKSATRRLSLFTGSSLVVASLATAAFTGVALAPGAALAANECTPTGATGATPGTNGATADTYACSATTYATGVTYDAEGNLTVIKTNTGTTTVIANGVNLTADGTETLTWDSVIGGVTGGTGTAGPVISATTTGNGLITVNTAAVTGSNASITYGIYTESTGGGDISINAAGGNISGSNSTTGIAGIYAASNGGDITIHQDFRNSQGSTSGRLYGILASTTGDGNLSLLATKGSSTGPSMNTVGSSGIAAVDASVQSGDLVIQVVGGVTNSNPNGIGIRATTRGGDALIDIIQGSIVAGATNTLAPNSTSIQVDMQGGLTTINNLGVGTLGPGSVNRRTDSLLRALGSGSIVLNNGSGMFGTFQLGDFTGPFTLNNSAPARGWATRGLSTFSPGADTLNNLSGGVITIGSLNSGGGAWAQSATWNLGTGVDTINNAGMIVVGENQSNNILKILAATLTISGLEQFNNSGLIVMGSYTPIGGALGAQTDLYYDDVLVMRDGHFHGDEGSRVWLDANLNNTGQTSCARNVEDLSEGVVVANPADARLRANDCLDFRGSAVSGRTGLIVADVIAGDRGAYNPEGNVVVDLSGSDPEGIDPNAFFMSPDTPGYNADNGGFLDKGLFAYTVGYDPEDQAFKIFGVASQSALQLPVVGQAANDLWRTSTSPWLGRRLAQRDAEITGELTSRFWIRGALSMADRVVGDSVAAGANVLEFDNSYNQDDGTLALGMDLLRGSGLGGEWVLGAMAGYAQSRVTYEASPNTATFEGGNVGLYGGFTAGPFFHDMVVNATLTNLLVDVPSLQLSPAGTVLESDVTTLGGRMETGWRFGLGPWRIEPLATVSWSQSSFDNMDVPADDPIRFGGEIEFDDARSLRAGLGVRLGMTDVAPLLLLPVDFTMTAKSMQEWDGEGRVTIANLGPDAVLSRTFDGAYNELNAGLSLGEEIGHVAGFINIGGAWGDVYEAKTGSLGLRLRW